MHSRLQRLILVLAGTELQDPPMEVSSHGRTDSCEHSRFCIGILIESFDFTMLGLIV